MRMSSCACCELADRVVDLRLDLHGEGVGTVRLAPPRPRAGRWPPATCADNAERLTLSCCCCFWRSATLSLRRLLVLRRLVVLQVRLDGAGPVALLGTGGRAQRRLAGDRREHDAEREAAVGNLRMPESVSNISHRRNTSHSAMPADDELVAGAAAQVRRKRRRPTVAPMPPMTTPTEST